MLIYKKTIPKKAKNIINKCYSSTISVQNRLKTPLKRTFFIKIKFVDNNGLFKQKLPKL